MGQHVQCENGHKSGQSHRLSARRFSESGSVGACYCGKPLFYTVSQYDPSEGVTRTYDVLKVKCFLSADMAEERGWDPIMFLLRNQKTGTTVMWPYYWKKDRNQKWANGQYPPLLNIDALKQVIEEFKMTL